MPHSNKDYIVFLGAEPEVVESLRPALEQEGYEPLVATGTGEALRLCREYHPKVILPDITSPLSRKELVEFLGDFKRLGFGNIGIVLLTKNDMPECQELKGIRYVREPYLTHDLVCAIKEVEEIILLKDERDMFLDQLTEYAKGLERMVKEQTSELVSANERLHQLSVTDDLTGVNNRRYFFQRLGEEMNQTIRYGHTISVMILDLDDFKNINDVMGHIVGDAVLREFASLLRNKLRKGETVSRYGGEEFAVILPHVKADDALRAAEAVRKKVESTIFSCSGQGIPVTVSIGVAELDSRLKDPDEVLQRADKALYKAKSEGKNRACIWPCKTAKRRSR